MPVPVPNLRVFLFTDLVESTGRLTSAADEIARHFTLTHETISQHGGTVSNETGDGVLALFASPLPAVQSALALLRALRDAEWNRRIPLSIRIGIHIGDAREIDGRLLGDAISFTQRVMSPAAGGQILVSSALAGLLPPEANSEFRLVDRGLFQLKGFLGNERIFEVVTDDFPSNPACPIPSSLPPHNLPRRLTSFVGREREIEKLSGLISRYRFVTLSGIGGGGKTRLALETGRRLLHTGREVRFANLGVLHDPQILPSVIATALALPGACEIQSVEEIAARTQIRDCLLILDNAEHLRADCAKLARTLLTQGGEGLNLLVTSREALQVQGELVWQIPALSLPEKATLKEQNLETIQASEAVKLFLERAALLDSEREYDAQDYLHIGEIVRRVEGLPLSIELAAAALVDYSLSELLMGNLFELPALPFPELDHQETVFSSIEWSLKLIEPEARTLLSCLWVFAGGFDRAATLAIAEDKPDDETFAKENISGLLDRLVGASLLHREVNEANETNEPRYTLPEAVRFYFAKIADPEIAAHFVQRHLIYYRTLAETQEPLLRGAKAAEALATLTLERDNLRMALTRAGHGEERLRLAGALSRYYMMTGAFTEGRIFLKNALEGTAGLRIPTRYRAKALSGEGVLARRQGDFVTAEACQNESLALYEAENDEAGIAEACNNLGVLYDEQGKPEAARQQYERSLPLWDKLGDTWRSILSLSNLGSLALNAQEYEEAELCYRKALTIAQTLDDPVQITRMQSNLALSLHHLKRYEEAEAGYRESLQSFRSRKDRYDEAITLNNLAEMRSTQKDVVQARELALESAWIALELDDTLGIAHALNTYGKACLETLPEIALVALSHAHFHCTTLKISPPDADFALNLQSLRERLGETRSKEMIERSETTETAILLKSLLL